jgi:DNA-binding transcriptional MerR regulator
MILQSFLSQDEEFSVPNVSQALGFHSGFLRDYPDLRNYAQNVAQQHNVRVRQRRYEQASARIAQFIEDARQDNKAMTIGEVEKHAGLPEGGLVRTYPELYAMVRRTVQEHRAQMKAARTEERCVRINEAAARLVAQGTRLTHKAILQEAGLHPGAARPDPTLLSLLRSWLGDFAARD